MTSSTARHTVTHASGVMTGAAALPRHGASGETVTAAAGIAALYAVPTSSRVTGPAACVIVVLMTLIEQGDGQQLLRVVIGHLG